MFYNPYFCHKFAVFTIKNNKMKTIIKKYLIVLTVLIATLNYAGNKNMSITNIDGKTVKVEFKSVKKGQKLSIKDANGVVMYHQDITVSGTYSRIFNLSKLENGKYTTELDKDYEIAIKNFSILNGIVSLQNEKTIFKPVVRIKNNLVLVSKISFDNAAVKVDIYYNDTAIFTETVADKNAIVNRVYELSKKEKGAYKVVITSENRYYIKNFTL